MTSLRRVVVALLALMAGAATGSFAAQQELNQTQRFPAAPGRRVVVDAATLAVHVRSADVREVEVATELRIGGVSEERAEGWITRHTPTLEDTPEALSIVARPGSDGFMWLGHLTARARIRLVLPPFVNPDLTTSSGDISIRGDFPATKVLLRTATGQVELVGAAAEADVRSASGDADFDLVRPLERLFARSASGDITLRGGAREVQVDTSSGDVRLENLSGSVRVESSNGKIILQWDRLDAKDEVRVKTSSGRVNLVLPEGTTARGYLRTTDGTIRSDLPGVVNQAGDTVELQGDGPLLEVESASGAIVVGYGVTWPQPTPTP